MQPEQPATPMQPAPATTSRRGEHSPHWFYRCEVCGEPVDVPDPRLLPTGKWGVIVRCDDHLGNYRKARPAPEPEAPTSTVGLAPRHPLADVTARREEQPRHLPTRERVTLTPAERMDYGVTVTIRHSDTDQMETLVGVGPVTTALRDVCERIDELNRWLDRWEIVSVSTPATIYADLQGMRDPDLPLPESKLLATVGRLDLLADQPRPWPMT